MRRPSKDEYYLNMARQVSQRGTCLRRRYGAVIVKDDQIISTGYAGAPRGVLNCDELGVCERVKQNVPSGQRYELCRSVHAEMNAVIHASRQQTIGATLYLHGDDLSSGRMIADPEPCQLCRRVIINAGISSVVSFRENGAVRRTPVTEWVEEENREARETLAALEEQK
ncbi:MAG: dCMP deaminase family protein [Desulfarculales bacterium]|jgi:dCMP deaminase|nr:dCMP deaminase family protein [Desulfarculales bacterium]